MYAFILDKWIARRLTSSQVQNYATKGFITQEEANTIIATPQI